MLLHVLSNSKTVFGFVNWTGLAGEAKARMADELKGAFD